jgi:hypothetical protein
VKTAPVVLPELLNMRELADYLRYAPPVEGERYRGQDKALAFLKRNGIPLEHRGRIVLVRRALVDAALRGEVIPPPPGRQRQQRGAQHGNRHH